jgi:hypothetical protein
VHFTGAVKNLSVSRGEVFCLNDGMPGSLVLGRIHAAAASMNFAQATFKVGSLITSPASLILLLNLFLQFQGKLLKLASLTETSLLHSPNDAICREVFDITINHCLVMNLLC